MSDEDEKLRTAPRTLRDIDLFAGLPAEALREIEQEATWHHFEEDDCVFDRHSDTLEVYFVASGAVRILSSGRGGQEVTLAVVKDGNYFGELAAIDGKGRSARVVAVGPCDLASLDGERFLAIMMRHPVVALRVMERFTRIIRSLDDRVTDLSTLSDTQRIYAELINMVEADPRRPNGRYIPEMPSHKEMASWTGTARETVAQAIGELARQGIVERRSKSLIVKDWPRLQLMARGVDLK